EDLAEIGGERGRARHLPGQPVRQTVDLRADVSHLLLESVVTTGRVERYDDRRRPVVVRWCRADDAPRGDVAERSRIFLDRPEIGRVQLLPTLAVDDDRR